MNRIHSRNPLLWLCLLLLAWAVLGVQLATPKVASGPFYAATEHHLGVTRWEAAPRLGLDAWTTKLASGDTVGPKATGTAGKNANPTSAITDAEAGMPYVRPIVKTPENTQIAFSKGQLQHAYKHASDFGVVGNANKSTLVAFESAVQKHISAPDTRLIQGLYRGQPATHFVDPNTGLNVIRDSSGNFLSGWKLNPQQLQHVFKDGKLGGG